MSDRVQGTRQDPVSLAGADVTMIGGEELREAVERQPSEVLRPGHVPDGVKVAPPAVVAAKLKHSQVSADDMMTYPFSSIGRIMGRPIASGGDFQGVCTGVLVGPNMVLTATHLLRDRPLSDWLFQFVPGYHNGERPLAPDGHVRGASFFTGRVVHGNADGSVHGSGPTEIVNGFDFSIFELANPLGDHWGHLGTITSSGSSFYEDRSWQSVGYPVTLGGEVPYRSPINVADVEKDDYGSREIETESLIGGSIFGPGVDWGGWSGGPLLTHYNGAWWVGGVLSGWDLDGPFDPDGVHVFSGGPRLGVLMDIAYDQFFVPPEGTAWMWLGGKFKSPPSVVSWAPNRLDIFGLGEDRSMFQKTWDGSQWLPSHEDWMWLGGTFTSPPSVVSWAPNRLDIFALGEDRSMFHKAWDGTQWWPSHEGWEWMGGKFTSPPTAVSWAPNRLDIFALGEDGSMFQKTYDGARWLPSDEDWTWLGGKFTSPPAVVSWAPNRLDIFGLGEDGSMFHKAWDGSQWWPSHEGWEWLGGKFTSPPTAVSWAPNRLDIFGLGQDGSMFQKTWDGSQWLPSNEDWMWLGGKFSSPPAVVSWAPNRLDIFGLGEDRSMFHKAWDGSQWWPSHEGWEWLGGKFTSPPAAVSWAPNRLDIFGLGEDGSMFQKTWDGSRWLP